MASKINISPLVTSTDIRSKEVVLSLLIYCLLLLPMLVWVLCVWFLFCNALLISGVLSSFAVISLVGETWLLYFKCFLGVVAVSVLYLFLAMPRVGLWSVIVAFRGQTHSHYECCQCLQKMCTLIR